LYIFVMLCKGEWCVIPMCRALYIFDHVLMWHWIRFWVTIQLFCYYMRCLLTVDSSFWCRNTSNDADVCPRICYY